jgi:integrase
MARERFYFNARAGDYGDIVRLLILTAQRREEIGGLERTEVADGLITFPPRRTKNRREHKIPVTAHVAAILQRRRPIIGRVHYFGIGGAGFSGWSKSKKGLDDATGVTDWRLHDLRRTADTLMNDELGIDPHVVEAILNHVSGAKSGKAGVAGVYNKAEYLAKKRAALEAWEAFILAAVEMPATRGDRPSAPQAGARSGAQAAAHRRRVA